MIKILDFLLFHVKCLGEIEIVVSVFQARPTMYNVVKEMIDKMGYKVRLVTLSCSHLTTDLNRYLLFDYIMFCLFQGQACSSNQENT